jgi:uncharacterized Zn-finger protein
MHDGTAFVCVVCERRFAHKAFLERHRTAHTFAKPIACNFEGCDKMFSRNGQMLMHNRTVHGNVRKYRCAHCDNTFTNSESLTRHRRMHTGERPYACTECEMRFTQKGNLQVHFRAKHTLERPYACDVDACEKKFARNDHMLNHKREVHEKVRRNM